MIRYCGIEVPPQSQKSFAIRRKMVAVKEMLARPMPMQVAASENWLPEMAQVPPVSFLGEESR